MSKWWDVSSLCPSSFSVFVFVFATRTSFPNGVLKESAACAPENSHGVTHQNQGVLEFSHTARSDALQIRAHRKILSADDCQCRRLQPARRPRTWLGCGLNLLRRPSIEATQSLPERGQTPRSPVSGETRERSLHDPIVRIQDPARSRYQGNRKDDVLPSGGTMCVLCVSSRWVWRSRLNESDSLAKDRQVPSAGLDGVQLILEKGKGSRGGGDIDRALSLCGRDPLRTPPTHSTTVYEGSRGREP